ncbi:hypothetical protein RJZ90_007190 [Blastomyces dermatitidis]
MNKPTNTDKYAPNTSPGQECSRIILPTIPDWANFQSVRLFSQRPKFRQATVTLPGITTTAPAGAGL